MDIDAVGLVERHFGRRMVRVSGSEYYSPDGCPWCGGKPGKSDRFRLFLTGNSAGPRVWCRRCGKVAFVDALDSVTELTDEEKNELRLAAIEARQEEQDRRVSTLEKMHECRDHIGYHENTIPNGHGLDYWLAEGITVPLIEKWKLGYCVSCPTASFSPSFTIPYMARGQLWDIRHRLESPNGSGRYRRHMAGLPHLLFNGDGLYRDTDDIYIVEGEKKGIVLEDRTGSNFVAVPGASGFKKAWASKFDRFKNIYVLYDPDATDKAAEVASWFGDRGRIIYLPLKADDFFVRAGASKRDFERFVSIARPA